MRQFVLVLVIGIAACNSEAKRKEAFDAAVETEWKPVEAGERAALAEAVVVSCQAARRHTELRFRRLVDPRSLDWVTDDTVGADARMQRFLVESEAGARIQRAYAECTMVRESLASATVLIEMFGRALPMIEQFMAGFPSDDPSLPARRDGFLQMRKAFAAMVHGWIMLIHDPGVGSSAELLPQARRIGAAVTRIHAGYPDELRPVIASIERMAESNADRREVLRATLPAQ